MPIWEYTAHSLTYMYLLLFPQVPMRLVDIFFPFNLRKFSPTTNNSSKLCYHVIIVRIVPLLQSSLYICANSNINARQRMPFFLQAGIFFSDRLSSIIIWFLLTTNSGNMEYTGSKYAGDYKNGRYYSKILVLTNDTQREKSHSDNIIIENNSLLSQKSVLKSLPICSTVRICSSLC